MTELKRIMVDGDWDLEIFPDKDFIAVLIVPKMCRSINICIASERTELEALVAARLALFRLYKACPEPPRSQPKPQPVEDAKV